LWFLLLLLVLSAVIPACRPRVSPEEASRLELVREIKEFEKRLGFAETENFLTTSEETEAYDYYFYTPSLEMPYSLDDPALQFGTGTRETVSFDPDQYDAYFYSIPALAGIKTPVTRSLLEAPLYRFIHIIFHEDWQEGLDLPLGIAEPSAELVGYAASTLFAEEKFGRDSEIYRAVQSQFENRLLESKVYRDYYEKLSDLYARYGAGKISRQEALVKKASLLEAMGNELYQIWGGKPDQLNNAFIAFQMTYLRHFPLMYEVFSATGFDLQRTMAILREIPGQGEKRDSLDRVKQIEERVTECLEGRVKIP
jgi:hypothetical protein